MEIQTQQNNLTQKIKNNNISDSENEKDFFDSKNKDNKDILNSIYGNEIFSIIDKVSNFKDDSKNYMIKTDEELIIFIK